MSEEKFKSDGCTWFPEGDWHGCCVLHDEAYYHGGSEEKKLKADLALLSCVALKGFPYIGIIMFIGVRVFGAPYWPHRLRWGRKHKYKNSFTYNRQEKI